VVEREAWLGRWHGIREHLTERNLGLVYSMLHRFNLMNQDVDDRLSDGMYALSRAVERFNPWKGYRFSTYACNVIVRELMRGRRSENRHRALIPIQSSSPFEHLFRRSDSGAALYAERLSRVIEGNLADLTTLEQKIIALRFLRADNQRVTFQKIGDAVGLSKERIRQIQTEALGKLREVLETDPILQ
jgi:RNA polymerase primary sigma factor